ncbi:hypothetical protein D3C76_1313950 [compost metagenome]
MTIPHRRCKYKAPSATRNGRQMTVRLPERRASTVNGQPMTTVNCVQNSQVVIGTEPVKNGRRRWLLAPIAVGQQRQSRGFSLLTYKVYPIERITERNQPQRAGSSEQGLCALANHQAWQSAHWCGRNRASSELCPPYHWWPRPGGHVR